MYSLVTIKLKILEMVKMKIAEKTNKNRYSYINTNEIKPSE